ncbi:MAG: DeoR/GlpR family DNA-binding transcription regulator [Sphaerochaetaceae bacterium]|jgi:DeoR family fructose operon transcriptional repressor|nr:DeoR/GlpR family DNA-binding transcription regulator [Sphaerochaetaceae bacterium]
MHATQRKNLIMQELQQNDSVDVLSLARRLAISKVTVRKDLDELADKGLVVRTHGGAVLAEKQNLVRLISNTITEHTEDKKNICAHALRFVEQGKSIIIDSGSTTVHLAPLVAKMNLSVITNSILVIQELAAAEAVELLIVGGLLRRPSLAAIGSPARSYLNQIHVDTLFLGASGFSVEQGITCTNLIEADTKQAMIASATKVILLADSSKFGTVSLAKVCNWEDIDLLITDDGLSDEGRFTLEAQGVHVQIARS